MNYTKEQIARALDLAVLKPTAATGELIAAARLVQEENIASLCVAPCNVRLAKEYTDRVCAVVGFPHGNTTPEVKEYEAEGAIEDGAIELDVVCNVGRFLEGWCRLHDNPPRGLGIEGVIRLAHRKGVIVKAILETACLAPEDIEELCEICVRWRADFVNTSTGFGPGGATPEAVVLMRDNIARIGRHAKVKASGGIKTYEDAALYLDLGCTRLGASTYLGLLP
jgi:deoxyribose-phosphate aldolase